MCNFLIMYLRVFFSLARLSVSREDLYFARTPINLLSVSLRFQFLMLTALLMLMVSILLTGLCAFWFVELYGASVIK